MTSPAPISERAQAMDIPPDLQQLIDVYQYEETGEFPVERGYIWTSASSVENANPLFWDDEVAAAITDGLIAMPTMLSLWFRPHHWSPTRDEPGLALQVHFDLKARLDLPEAIMSDNTITFYDPVRIGDRLRTRQVLRSVSGPKTTKLGTGRFWVIEVEYRNQHDALVGIESYTGFGYKREPVPAHRAAASATSPEPASPEPTSPDPRPPDPTPPGAGAASSSAAAVVLLASDVHVGDSLAVLAYPVTATTVVLGALAARDWRPMHHDHDFAVNRNGTKDIFLNTPNQAAWFERFLTDWTGPHGRLGRMTFRMKGSVFPGDTMVLAGTVTEVETDDTGCTWVTVLVRLTVDDDLKTDCTARVALPSATNDNPWRRRGNQWNP